jgi:hypothetical protein
MKLGLEDGIMNNTYILIGNTLKKYKLVNIKDKTPCDIYIGRSHNINDIWGNPYTTKDSKIAEFKVDTKEEAITKYETYLRNNPELLDKLKDLKGKVLGCWCTNKTEYKETDKLICHGQILLKLLQEYY